MWIDLTGGHLSAKVRAEFRAIRSDTTNEVNSLTNRWFFYKQPDLTVFFRQSDGAVSKIFFWFRNETSSGSEVVGDLLAAAQ